MADKLEQPPKDWTESQVSTWLRYIGVKEQYIKKLYEEEVDGQILLALNEDFLKTKICMKSGPAHLIIEKRGELINTKQKSQEKKKPTSGQTTQSVPKSAQCLPSTSEGAVAQSPERDQNVLKGRQASQEQSVLTSKDDCRPRPFDQEGIDFIYVKHRVLQPESGAFNLTSPCHEFKSLSTAATLDRTRLQAKFAKEVLKFATGCMNIRSNGTIHFGVMDSKEDAGYMHGEVIGVPVIERDIYVDALDYIERSFSSDKEHVRQCVRPPRFIEVMDRESSEKKYVIEVDIVPSLSVVKSKVYSVRLPNFNKSSNKVEFEKETILRRVGAKTEPVGDISDFYERVKDRDAQREEAEKCQFFSAPYSCQDLGRKLMMLMTSGKKFIEKDKWFIFITNKFNPDDLCNIDWLLNMSLFCVFDFDPDSKTSGLCRRYLQHHSANMHSLQSYRISGDMTIKEFTDQLHLFEQTSWIFCNGCADFKGSEAPCDEMTWIKTKMTVLRESVSLICKQILPKGTFQVIFLLTSPVEKPLLHTFNEFFTDMEGHEDIICICESQDNFQKWQSFAEGSCGAETVNNSSVVGMKMSHINATLLKIQPINACASKHLPVSVKGTCLLETQQEEQMCSLEILTVNHCDETSKDFIDEEKVNIEHQFYRGRRVNWLNFWLAENKHVGEVIERDAYHEVSEILHNALKRNPDEPSVNIINIYHHPGSGGSTVARQVLWNNRKDLRCAVVKPSYSVAVVAQHAVELREYEEKDPQRCLPVLLLIEDPDKEYLDDLRNELEAAIHTRRLQYLTPCFILLTCRRSYDPEKKCKESPLQNVSVTHQLSPLEKRKFSGKLEVLQEQYEPEFILTFVICLMNKEFNKDYVQEFVEHLLQGIDRKSVVTRLILYVALLNTYVQDSFISQSHCEALLALTIHLERFHQHEFEKSLSPQAKLVFLHLRDDKTHIESIKIIHPLVAKEILQQLLGTQQTQSSLAMNLLYEDVLFQHRFGREEYRSFLRAFFIRRSRISKGDKYDSFFSPLIEHVCENESSGKAIELLKEAFQRFHKDPFFAQQLARLHYTYEKFEEAKQWAETAAIQLPNNSYILDTKGQVYKKWFQAKCKAIDSENVPKTAQNIADAVETALKAMECFQESEKAADADMVHVNSSGFFAEVEVGCSLLKLISSLEVFANRGSGHSECMKYLVTNYIPVEVEDAWEPFHGRLKKLHQTLQDALEWISEDLSYFQTDIDAGEEETSESPEEKISHPLKWLAKKSSEYGNYFSEADCTALLRRGQSVPGTLTPFQKRMIIYQLGGGNTTSILYKLTDQKDPVRFLETILSLYPSNPRNAKLIQRDIINYIVAHISLNCLSPDTQKTAPLRDLQALSRQFPADKRKCLPSSLFVLTLLYWPEDHDTGLERENKYEIVQSAVEHLEKGYWAKMKDIPQRKRRIYTHFFLGNGNGLDKFVHKRKFEKVTKGFSVSEKRMKWFRGEAWKKPEIANMLKSVSGWTEDGVVYLEGPQKKKFSLLPLHVPSVPYSNENITFYLGFTFRGPVACNIVVTK
ncbi:sterile alpha motif domain-containing protein 9-like [Pempheris klunzingeri]|uniref:sterile alpha motif domain-containing protein 9-like n=1 Tax=Pempheris klunzingeri TaxID=3127111 RepID=UPI0039808B92